MWGMLIRGLAGLDLVPVLGLTTSSSELDSPQACASGSGKTGEAAAQRPSTEFATPQKRGSQPTPRQQKPAHVARTRCSFKQKSTNPLVTPLLLVNPQPPNYRTSLFRPVPPFSGRSHQNGGGAPLLIPRGI